MACDKCNGYYRCVCDERVIEQAIKNLENEIITLRDKLIELRSSREDPEQ